MEPTWSTALWTSPCRGDRLSPTGDDGGAGRGVPFPGRAGEPAGRGGRPLDHRDQPDSGYNPLVLYGPSGSGKSHIAQGLATVWKARNRRHRVVCTTAVDFARELADAIESQAVEEFRVKHRTADLLVIEDLGLLATRKVGKTERPGGVYSYAGCVVGGGRLGGGDGFRGAGGVAGTVAGVAEPAGGRTDDPLGAARPRGPAWPFCSNWPPCGRSNCRSPWPRCLPRG